MTSADASGVGAATRSDRMQQAFESVWIMGPVLAVLNGILVNWGMQGEWSIERGGYTAGTGDHYVLGPEGLRQADPTRFVGDFFLDAAPEPHWFFDIVTRIGASTGDVSGTYLIYWFIGLLFFGFGAAMLAKSLAPRMAWAAGIAFTFVMFLAPWGVAGTGSPMISSPIPAVVGGYAAFLAFAALLTGRHAVTAFVATAVAVLHVQQGLVIALVLGVTVIALWIRDRRPQWWLVAGTLGSGAFVTYGLTSNSFGGAISEFVAVCDEMIPYHCSAHLWSGADVIAAIALVLLSAFSVRLMVPRESRVVWYTSVGLVGFGLLSGMFADILRIPVLGELAQGSNIYRLGAVVIFFAAWGLLAFLLRPARSRIGLVAAAAWLIVAWTYLSSGGWQFAGATGRKIYVVLGIIAVIGAAGPWIARRGAGRLRSIRPWLAPSALVGTMAVLAIAAIVGGFIVPRSLDPQYIPDDDKKEWGAAVEAVVPPGELLLHAPNAPYIRLASARGNIGDCKSVPYGGEPYRAWKKHIDALGGWETQCHSPFPAAPFNDLTAAELDDVAETYDLDYMVLEEAQLDVLPDLEGLGWSVVLEPVNDLQNYVLRRD